MLRTFHRFQSHLSWFVLLAAIVLAMSGFGIHWFTPTNKVSAVRIDKTEIGFEEFSKQVQSIERQYRQMFGANFDKIAPQLNLNIPQQVVDKVISETLTERNARALKLEVGDVEFKNTLKSEVFPDGYSADRYRGILSELGMTQEKFESDLRAGALRAQYIGLLKDASRPSLRETNMRYERAESKYEVRYLEFSPEKFEKDVTAPDEATLRAYYDEHVSDFEKAPRVTYDYVSFDPAQFADQVQVADDEIEFAYTEGIAKYTPPEKVKVRHVQLNFPIEKNAEKMAAVKAKAEEVLQKAQAGESMESLALQYSDDIPTKTLGGDLGWISAGKMPKEFDEAVAKTAVGNVTPLISTDYGYNIAKVEDRKASEPKKLEEVRAQIISEFQKQEAPAYAAEKARSLYDEWTKGKQPFAEFAAAHKLTVLSSKSMIEGSQDPEPTLTGLTAGVLEYPEDEKALLIELPSRSVLVSVKERRDIEVAPFEEVKAKIVDSLKKTAAKTAAFEKAKSVAAKLAGKGTAEFDAAAKENGISVKEEKDLSYSKQAKGAFGGRDIRKSIFAVTTAHKIIPKSFESEGKFYVVQVASITKPEAPKDEKVITKYIEQQESDNTEALVTSLINSEKTKSEIVVNDGIVGRS